MLDAKEGARKNEEEGRLDDRDSGGPAGAFAPVPSRGTILAFDFGVKRIGVAVGELELRQAHPLAVIGAAEAFTRWQAIGALFSEWRPVRVIVGVPSARDGTAHEMTRRCQRFARQLAGRFKLPIETVDERLSSIAAGEMLRAAGVAPGKRRARRDAAAAAIILQTYFDELARRRTAF